MKSFPPLMVELARLSKSFSWSQKRPASFISRQRAHLAAQFKSVHVWHVTSRKMRSNRLCDSSWNAWRGPHADRLEFGLLQGVGEGPREMASSSTTRTLASTSCLAETVVPRSKRIPRKSMAEATVRMVRR